LVLFASRDYPVIERTEPTLEGGPLVAAGLSPGQSSLAGAVVEFCDRHGVTAELGTALRLLRECFPAAEAMQARLNEDPESTGEWVVVNAVVRGEPDKAFEAHRECLRRWTAAVGWPATGLICLTYTFA
jgi:hypothetical protein